MKRVNKYILRVALLVAACVCILPANADNTEFNKESNFIAYPAGPGAIHFQMISFVSGKDHDKDHWAIKDAKCSYVEYSSDKQTWYKLFYYYGHRDKKDEYPNTVDVMIPKDDVDRGVLAFTGTPDGVDIALSANGAFKNIKVKTGGKVGGRDANFLRLGWNVPQDVRDADSVYLRCHVRQKGSDNKKYSSNNQDSKKTFHFKFTYIMN